MNNVMFFVHNRHLIILIQALILDKCSAGPKYNLLYRWQIVYLYNFNKYYIYSIFITTVYSFYIPLNFNSAYTYIIKLL